MSGSYGLMTHFRQRLLSGSCLVVEPQYYLTGEPRQGYMFKSSDF